MASSRTDAPRARRHALYAWSFYDRQFRMAARNGVHILPILIGSPEWGGTPVVASADDSVG